MVICRFLCMLYIEYVLFFFMFEDIFSLIWLLYFKINSILNKFLKILILVRKLYMKMISIFKIERNNDMRNILEF